MWNQRIRRDNPGVVLGKIHHIGTRAGLSVIYTTGQCYYNVESFPQNAHNGHLVAHCEGEVWVALFSSKSLFLSCPWLCSAVYCINRLVHERHITPFLMQWSYVFLTLTHRYRDFTMGWDMGCILWDQSLCLCSASGSVWYHDIFDSVIMAPDSIYHKMYSFYAVGFFVFCFVVGIFLVISTFILINHNADELTWIKAEVGMISVISYISFLS